MCIRDRYRIVVWRIVQIYVAQPLDVQRLQRIIVDTDRCDVCLLYTSDAADERSSVDLGGRRIIKKTNDDNTTLTHEQDKKIHDRR